MADLVIASADVAPVIVIEKFTGPANEAINAGQYVRYNVSNGKIELGNGTTAAEARSGGLALTTAQVGETVTVLKKGVADVGKTALDALAYDADVFLSNTDGTLADATGTVTKIVGQVIPGWAYTTADKLLRVDA